MAGASTVVKIIFEGKDNLSNVTKGIADELGGKGGGIGGALKNIGLVAGGAVVGGIAAAGAALGAFAANGTKNAIQLEQQIANIGAVMGASGEDLSQLNDLILDLGVDPNLKVSTFEAADAIEMLARNGLSMTEIMDGAARSTVILANATGADFGLAADIATDTMALFNIEAKDMSRAVDGITSVVNNSKFSIDDYRLALAQGGGVAASVGVEFEDFNSSIAAISPLFASGSDAGTSFKVFLQRLVPSTSKAQEAMAELGLASYDTTDAFNFLSSQGYAPLSMSLEDINGQFADMQSELGLTDDEINELKGSLITSQNAFFDANGNMKSMAEISSLLSDATKGLTEEQKNQYMSTIFGTDAMRAAFGLAESGTVVYTDIAKAAEELGVSQDILNQYMEGGITQFEALQAKMSMTDAADAVSMRMNTLSGQMEILSGTVEGFGIKVGQAFMPALKMMVSGIQSFVDDHGEQLVAMFNVFAEWLSNAIPQAINTTVSFWNNTLIPAFELASSFINSTLIPAFLSLQSGINSAISFIRSIIDGFSSGTITPFGDNWIIIQGVIQTAWLTIQGVIQGAIAVIQPAIQTFVDTFQSRFGEFQTLIPGFQALWEAMWPAVKLILEALGALILGIIAITISMVNGVAEALNPLITTWELIVAGVTKTLTGLFDFINNFAGLILGIFQGNNELIEQSFYGMGQALLTIVTGMAETIVGAIMGMVATIMSFISGFVEGMITFFQTLYETLVGGSIIPDMVEAIIMWINSMVTTVMQVVTQWVIDFINAINTMIASTLNVLISSIGSFKSAAISIMTGFLDGVASMMDSIVGKVDSIARAMYNKFMDKVDKFKSVGKDIISGVIKGIMENKGKLLEKIEEVIGSTFKFLKDKLGIGSPSKEMAWFGDMMGKGLVMGLDNMKPAIAQSIAGLIPSEVTSSNNAGNTLTNNTQTFNLTINSSANQQGIIQDYKLMKARMAVV